MKTIAIKTHVVDLVEVPDPVKLARKRIKSAKAAHVTTSGRIVASYASKRRNLVIAWFDPDDDVATCELVNVPPNNHWIVATDGRHAAFADEGASLRELELVPDGRGGHGVVVTHWRPDTSRMMSYSYDYVDPDHLLIVADLGNGGAEAHLLRRKEGKFQSIAIVDDVKCDDVLCVPPFAFLAGAKRTERIVLGARGGKLAHLGRCEFPSEPKSLRVIDGRLVYTNKRKTMQVDGLYEALDVALGGKAKGVAKKPVPPKLDGVELVRALGEALQFDKAPPRDKLVEALRLAEATLGFSIDKVPARSKAELAKMPPHVLVVWMTDADAHIDLFAVPVSAIDAKHAAALKHRIGVFAGAVDFDSADAWTAANRLMVAIGETGGLDRDECYERYTNEGEQEGMWNGARPVPPADFTKSWRTWKTYRVAKPSHLDRRFMQVRVLQLAT